MTSLDQTASDRSRAEQPAGAVPSGTRSPTGRAGANVEAATAAGLLAGLAARLRSAYEQGVGLAELAAACHQPLPAVRRLLEGAGVNLAAEPPVPAVAASDAPEARQLRRLRRPTPSRRLRRVHPQPRLPGDPHPTDGLSANPADGAGRAAEDSSVEAGAGGAGAPLGILIGASPSYVEPTGPSGPGQPRRVAGRVLRVSRGTSLVLLPEWRAAIAVSVPTERLLGSTGLRFEELASARLTVLINPEALHDRELGLRDWQAEPRRARGR